MPELRPSDWARIERVLPVPRDWRQEPFSTSLEPLQLASRLDALAVHFLAEAREARQLATNCKQYASRLRAGVE